MADSPPLTFVAADPHFSRYVARAGAYELSVTNEDPDRDAAVFPEPPLTVRRVASGATCAIQGGIWVRAEFRLIGGGAWLAVHEYNGSNDEIVIYRLSDCTVLRRVPLPERVWAAIGSTVFVGRDCADGPLPQCRHRTAVTLGSPSHRRRR